MYRPDGWPKCPCDDCPDKEEDNYGMLCDLACGKHSAWINFEAGADAMHIGDVTWIKEHLTLLTKDNRTGVVSGWLTSTMADWEDFIRDDGDC